MTETTPSPEPQWLALGAGRVCLHWLAAGTTLVALEGSVQLEPPSRWLAGMAPTLWHPLGAGHAHVLETSGWWGAARRRAQRCASAHRGAGARCASADLVAGVAAADGMDSAAPDIARLIRG